jgi:hypothetical protein
MEKSTIACDPTLNVLFSGNGGGLIRNRGLIWRKKQRTFAWIIGLSGPWVGNTSNYWKDTSV